MVKLTTVSKKFKVLDGNKVECTLVVSPKVDILNDSIQNAFDINDVPFMSVVTFKGYAVCHKDDTFSLEKGERVAFSNAKIKAHKKFLKVYKDALSITAKRELELLNDVKKLQNNLKNEVDFASKF